MHKEKIKDKILLSKFDIRSLLKEIFNKNIPDNERELIVADLIENSLSSGIKIGLKINDGRYIKTIAISLIFILISQLLFFISILLLLI